MRHGGQEGRSRRNEGPRVRRELGARLRSLDPGWHGKGRSGFSAAAKEWMSAHSPPATLENPQRAEAQLGSLGSGNHFIELAVDQDDGTWTLLHSGIQETGQPAGDAAHQGRDGPARTARNRTRLTRSFRGCRATRLRSTPTSRNLRWAQAFALENRRLLLDAAHHQLNEANGEGISTLDEVNCHHNYTELEEHHGKWLWVTRKGAIRAGVGDRGAHPGREWARSRSSFEASGTPCPTNHVRMGRAGFSPGRRPGRRYRSRTSSPR